ISAQVSVTPDREMSYTNVNEKVWQQLSVAYAGQLAGLTFVDANPDDVVNTTAFQKAFKDIWRVSRVDQVTAITDSAAFTTGPKTGSTKRPGIEVSLANSTQGELLPLKYHWSYTWKELSDMLGVEVDSREDVLALLSALRVNFQAVNSSTTLPVVGTAADFAAIQSIDAGDAYGKKALEVDSATGGLTFSLTSYLANVRSTGANDGPQFVGTDNASLLIVPDGVESDGKIAGTMWMTAEKTDKGGTGDGEGGGGCDAAGLGLAALLLPALLASPRKNRDGGVA
ncbi:MAG: hypothetical protein IJ702_01670, partial [Fretibacterium sp.]|nr:hypothetical protein [Fretibacterium sp.]